MSQIYCNFFLEQINFFITTSKNKLRYYNSDILKEKNYLTKLFKSRIKSYFEIWEV